MHRKQGSVKQKNQLRDPSPIQVL